MYGKCLNMRLYVSTMQTSEKDMWEKKCLEGEDEGKEEEVIKKE